MRKRFVVVIERSTESQNNALLDWIKAEGLGWWHWFQNAWLLSNNKGHLDCERIRDKLMEIYGSANNLVIEMGGSGDSWAAYGPSNEKKSMFTWLRDTWSKIDE